MRSSTRWSAIPLLAAALWLAGCADQGGPTAPAMEPAAQAPSQSLSLQDDMAAILKGEMPDLSARVNQKVIGPEGGTLYVSLNYLQVPRGAVTRPTLFRMELSADGSIGADLTATTMGSRVRNDVGARGFKRPVYLTFNYELVKNPPENPHLLKVFWAKPDGTYEAQPTYVLEKYRVATGVLTHFSDYVLAIP